MGKRYKYAIQIKVKMDNKLEKMVGVVALTYNPSTLGGQGTWIT